LIHSISVMIPFFFSILDGKGDSKIGYFKHNCLLRWSNYLQSELSTSESNFNNMPTRNMRFFSKLRNYPSAGTIFITFFTTFTMSTSSVTSEILTDSRQGKFLKHFRQLVLKGDRSRRHLAKIMLSLCTPRNYMCQWRYRKPLSSLN
jgi:hypothetical protein